MARAEDSPGPTSPAPTRRGGLLIAGLALLALVVAQLVYVATTVDHHPGRVVPASRPETISTIAGAPCVPDRAARVALQPVALAADGAGGVYLADGVHSAICRITADGAVTTVAGNGALGFLGDRGPGPRAELYLPSSLALSASGDVIVADRWNQRIRKIASADGTITTTAGNGTGGSAGDGGPADQAQLNFPSGVALDRGGTLYVADSKNDRVRAVSAANGTITTIAGTGTDGFSGDGGPATRAALKNPTSVAVAGGVLYIADTGNNRIRQIQLDTGTISTVVGTGAGGFNGDGRPGPATALAGPTSVAVDPAGNLLFADTLNERIRLLDQGNGLVSTVAGTGAGGFGGDGGPASAALLDYPAGVAVDGASVWIADTNNHRVRRVDRSTGRIATWAGNGYASYSGDGGPAQAAELNEPIAVAAGPGGPVVADSLNHVLRAISPDGNISTVAGSGVGGFGGDGGPAVKAKLNFPAAVVITPRGDVLVADRGNNRVRKISASDGTISTIAGTGPPGFAGDGGPATAAQLNSPSGLALDAVGDVFIADSANNRVRELRAADGTITTIAGNGQPGFSGDDGEATAAELNGPTGLAVGASGAVFIADTRNQRVRRVDPAGKIATVVGSGQLGYSPPGTPALLSDLNFPIGLVVEASGAVLIADSGNCLVRRVASPEAPGEVITTVAGWPPIGGVTPVCGYGGDGSPPALGGTMLDHPTGLALEETGSLLISDSLSNAVRAITPGR